jgi:hypothetical protein
LADPFENVKIREEDFGGILYHTVSDTVYRVNPSGFRLFKELRAAFRDGMQDLREFESADFRREDVKRFVGYLREQSIWQSGGAEAT